jgi:putative ABC transport system ATP-binding protein
MIELEGVEKEYSTTAVNVRALAGVDLRIASGEFVAVTGASGSGKSTLLNILGCLDRPTSGRYRLEGAEIDGCSDEALSAIRNRRIGFVFQSFHLLPRLTILENVLLPLRFARAEVSGGLEHAHALLARVALLLADEPTGNLDSRSAADILSLMAELHAEGQTIVMVTHDLELAGRAQRRVHLKDGSIDHDSMR